MSNPPAGSVPTNAVTAGPARGYREVSTNILARSACPHWWYPEASVGSLPQARCLVLIAGGMLALACGGGHTQTPSAATPGTQPTPPSAASPQPPVASPLPDGQPVWIPPGTF